MSWSDFYLICFLVGFGLSALSFVAGTVHLHLPNLHIHHGIHLGHAHVGHSGGGKLGRVSGRTTISFFNFGTMAAFLTWFGGTGFILVHVYSVWFLLALGISTVSGIGSAAVMFWFLAKVLMGREAPLDPADYDMVGVLGKLSISIRPGGTGEIIYSQGGTRRVAGARSEDGVAIPKGAEVMVTRYEKGIAYVRLWQDAMGELELGR